MTEIARLMPYPLGPRAETGPMQFGDDWPGVFIRGDEANHFAYVLDAFLTAEDWDADRISMAVLKGLAATLASCRVPPLQEAPPPDQGR